MVVKRNGKSDFKKFTAFIFYCNKNEKVIKVFECPRDLSLHDRHYYYMLADPGYLSKI